MNEQEELLRLTKENNILLKQILQILTQDDTTKSFMINVLANMLSGNRY